MIQTNLLDEAANIDQRIEAVYGAKLALLVVS